MRTFCSGVGRFAAERRTSVSGATASVEAAATWIWLDAETLRPSRFPPEFVDVYAESAGGRGTNVRVHHPDPPEDAAGSEWRFRADDVDVAGHVNNSHYWAPIEEEWRGRRGRAGSTARSSTATPRSRALRQVLSDGAMRWIVDDERRVNASIELG